MSELYPLNSIPFPYQRMKVSNVKADFSHINSLPKDLENPQNWPLGQRSESIKIVDYRK